MEVDTTLAAVQKFCELNDDLNKDIDFLIDSGCDKSNLLHTAIEYDRKEIFDLLIQEGAKINQPNKGNFVPINYASKLGKTYYVVRLLEHESDPSYVDGEQYTPLIYAVKNNNLEIAELLLKYHAPTSTIDHQTNALREAILQNNPNMVYLLMQYCANPYLLDDSHESLLKLAVDQKNTDIFKVLVSMGSSTDEIQNCKLPKKFEKIKKEFKCVPVEESDYVSDSNKIIESLRDDFDNLKERSEKTMMLMKKIDFEEEYISPYLNSFSAMTMALVKFVKKLDKYAKYYYAEKFKMINAIFGATSKSEIQQITQEFNDDERQWYKLFEKTKQEYNEKPIAFNIGTTFKLEMIKKSMTPLKDSVCIPERKTPDDLNRVKGNLATLNRHVAVIDKIIFEMYHLMEIVFLAFRNFLIKAKEALEGFLETLLSVREAASDVPIDATRDRRIEEGCALQCDLIMTDITALTWKEEKLDELSSSVMQCLRMMIQ